MISRRDDHVGESYEGHASVTYQSTDMMARSICRWVRAVFVMLVVVWLTILTSPILIPQLFTFFFFAYVADFAAALTLLVAEFRRYLR